MPCIVKSLKRCCGAVRPFIERGCIVNGLAASWETARFALGIPTRCSLFKLMLTDGIAQDLIALRNGISTLMEGGSTPSMNVPTRHFDTTIVGAIELYETRPDEYARLLMTAHMVDYVNRRLDQLFFIQGTAPLCETLDKPLDLQGPSLVSNSP